MEVFSEILGRSVVIPDEPERIVSLAPAITETLFLLGVGDRVVGVSYFCRRPRGVEERPRVGGYLGVNYRLLDELEPDLVLVTTGIQYRVARELAEKGYPVYPIPLPTSLHGVLDNILLVGLIVNRVGEARRLVEELAGRLSRLRGAGGGLSTYYEVDLGGPVTVGAASYIDHALWLIGLRNVFSGTRRAYFTPSEHELRKLDPDLVIYEPRNTGVQAADIARMLRERGLGEWRAVREERIIVLEPDSLAHYGPSLVSVLEEIVERLRHLA